MQCGTCKFWKLWPNAVFTGNCTIPWPNDHPPVWWSSICTGRTVKKTEGRRCKAWEAIKKKEEQKSVK